MSDDSWILIIVKLFASHHVPVSLNSLLCSICWFVFQPDGQYWEVPYSIDWKFNCFAVFFIQIAATEHIIHLASLINVLNILNFYPWDKFSVGETRKTNLLEPFQVQQLWLVIQSSSFCLFLFYCLLYLFIYLF